MDVTGCTPEHPTRVAAFLEQGHTTCVTVTLRGISLRGGHKRRQFLKGDTRRSRPIQSFSSWVWAPLGRFGIKKLCFAGGDCVSQGVRPPSAVRAPAWPHVSRRILCGEPWPWPASSCVESRPIRALIPQLHQVASVGAVRQTEQKMLLWALGLAIHGGQCSVESSSVWEQDRNKM